MSMESISVSELEALKYILAFFFLFPSLSSAFILSLSFLGMLEMESRVSEQAIEESRVS